ncbi:MAG: glycosyltransferase [Pseudomonadota bacterium]
MTTRVTLHDYRTDPLLPQKDGVNLAHENFATLLRQQDDPNLIVSFHDFTRLLVDETYAHAMLDDVDCVVSNVGPHAHFYFWLREQLGLNYRIIRDARTAIWSSYLHQEYLCAPYLRAGDTLLVASHYTWGVYNKIFPHLANFPTLLCYPLTACFPVERPVHRAIDRPPGGDFVLGYLGRLSEDKNFPDIVELLIRLNNQDKRGYRYRLIACGDVHSDSCTPSRIQQRILEALGPGDFFDYLPARNNSEIWDVMALFDVMIFPSTSNLETLGRVLIEASYARVPILSGDHAATVELVAPGGLCRVDYRLDETFSAHFDHRLGSISMSDMIDVITRQSFGLSDCYDRYDRHPEIFLERIADPAPALATPRLEAVQRAFIDMLSVDMPAPLDRKAADAELSNMVDWFIDLQKKGASVREERLVQLTALSRHPDRTARFVRKSETTSCDFTNVGGIDIELCHISQFYPEFRISRQ